MLAVGEAHKMDKIADGVFSTICIMAFVNIGLLIRTIVLNCKQKARMKQLLKKRQERQATQQKLIQKQMMLSALKRQTIV